MDICLAFYMLLGMFGTVALVAIAAFIFLIVAYRVTD